MEISVKVERLLMDPLHQSPVMILREIGGTRVLPIWIGHYEAGIIAALLEEIAPPRPMTVDLIASMLDELNCSVKKAVVCDLKESTYFARLTVCREDGTESEIDARPTDSVALTLRSTAPLYVEEHLLKAFEPSESIQNLFAKPIKDWLNELDPKDLGKYKM